METKLEPMGAVFYKEGPEGDGNAILSKLREDGKRSRAAPRKQNGFGAKGLVGVAIHPPRGGYWAVVDSAHGSQGIGPGEWSRVAVTVGDDTDVRARLRDEGIPIDESQRPGEAGDDALLTTLKYDAAVYRSGPDAELAEKLLLLRRAFVAGKEAQLRPLYEAIPEEMAPLALGVLRDPDEGRSTALLRHLAEELLAGELRPRDEARSMTRASRPATTRSARPASSASMPSKPTLSREAPRRRSPASPA